VSGTPRCNRATQNNPIQVSVDASWRGVAEAARGGRITARTLAKARRPGPDLTPKSGALPTPIRRLSRNGRRPRPPGLHGLGPVCPPRRGYFRAKLLETSRTAEGQAAVRASPQQARRPRTPHPPATSIAGRRHTPHPPRAYGAARYSRSQVAYRKRPKPRPRFLLKRHPDGNPAMCAAISRGLLATRGSCGCCGSMC